MTTFITLWFHKFIPQCRAWLERLQPAHHSLPSLDQMRLAPLEEPAKEHRSMDQEVSKSQQFEQKTLTVTQWSLDTNPEEVVPNNVNVMEVVFFPQHPDTKNYTVEGNDPNLRITHFSTSTRLH